MWALSNSSQVLNIQVQVVQVVEVLHTVKYTNNCIIIFVSTDINRDRNKWAYNALSFIIAIMHYLDDLNLYTWHLT